MKNSKKALLIGLGATAAIAAIAAALAYEEEAVDKIGSYLNRQRMKNFVRCFNKEIRDGHPAFRFCPSPDFNLVRSYYDQSCIRQSAGH